MKSLPNGAVCICGCSKLMISKYIFLRSIVIQTKRCVITKMKNAAISELIKSGFWANSKIYSKSTCNGNKVKQFIQVKARLQHCPRKAAIAIKKYIALDH